MAGEGKHRRPELSGFRIWPGVTLIAVCAFLVFLTVYLIAYHTNLIPLPEYVEALLQKNQQIEETTEIRSNGSDLQMPPQETGSREIFDPTAMEPSVFLASLTSPKKYYQRMQVVYQQDSHSQEYAAEVYRMDTCWKLILQDHDSDRINLYLCDGETLYRENVSVWLDGMTTSVGTFTPENILGLPSLADLKTWENITLTYLSAGKNLQFSHRNENGLQYTGVIAMDTGLLTEIRIWKNDTVFLTMYTERFNMEPAEMQKTDFFTIPENGGIDR